METADFLLLLAPGTRCLSLSRHGAIVGTVFRRHGPARPLDTLDAGESDQTVASHGGKLLTHFWGGYVALISHPQSPLLLRDPSGAMPCYVARSPNYILAASHVDLLLATKLVEPSIDWNALAFHMYSAGLPTPRTVLAGIDELLPGFAVELVDPARAARPRWSPWDHVHAGEGQNATEWAERLRRTVIHCVRGWTSSFSRLLLSVSGGLDSSIVAACLAAQADPEIHCLTMFSDDAGGDEREYARALCRHLALPLTECRYRVEDVDIEAPLGSHLPRPFGRTQADAYERAHVEAALAFGADAFATGNGGDNVFAFSQSAAAISDRYLCEGAGAGLLATMLDVCRQTGCSAFEAVRGAVRILWSPRSYQWQPSPSFLHPQLLAQLADSRLEHPWLDAPGEALPGKVGHVAGLLRVQPNLHPGRTQLAPVLNPLLSQPVMEACLAIPSWHWRAGGFDRAVARDAFARELPDLIAKRRSKGGPDGFTAKLIHHYRPRIRERLLDGRLARHALIDTAAIEQMLRNDKPTLGKDRTRLLALLATEAWLDYWCDRLNPAGGVGGGQRRPSAGPNV